MAIFTLTHSRFVLTASSPFKGINGVDSGASMEIACQNRRWTKQKVKKVISVVYVLGSLVNTFNLLRKIIINFEK